MVFVALLLILILMLQKAILSLSVLEKAAQQLVPCFECEGKMHAGFSFSDP